jgi:hypothetical protein
LGWSTLQAAEVAFFQKSQFVQQLLHSCNTTMLYLLHFKCPHCKYILLGVAEHSTFLGRDFQVIALVPLAPGIVGPFVQCDCTTLDLFAFPPVQGASINA